MHAIPFLLLTAALGVAAQPMVVEDFRVEDAECFPSDWKARGKDAKSLYRVVVEDGEAYLAAGMENNRGSVGHEFRFEPTHYPVLTWRWRVWEAPEGGNERVASTNDSAAAVYVVFPGFIVPRTIKYTWSASLTPDETFHSPSSSKTRGIVLRGPEAPNGEWLEERVDIVRDYRRLFGEDPPEARGIGIQSDSDSTKGSVRADYDALVLWQASATVVR